MRPARPRRACTGARRAGEHLPSHESARRALAHCRNRCARTRKTGRACDGARAVMCGPAHPTPPGADGRQGPVVRAEPVDRRVAVGGAARRRRLAGGADPGEPRSCPAGARAMDPAARRPPRGPGIGLRGPPHPHRRQRRQHDSAGPLRRACRRGRCRTRRGAHAGHRCRGGQSAGRTRRSPKCGAAHRCRATPGRYADAAAVGRSCSGTDRDLHARPAPHTSVTSARS